MPLAPSFLVGYYIPDAQGTWNVMRKLRPIIERHGYVFAVICIAASSGLFLLGRGYFARGQWALLYLLAIGLVAGLSGVRPALLSAVMAFLAWNYLFIPPFHTLTVRDPKDWLSLFAFLFVGVAVGLQTGRLREREAEALTREGEMAILNEFSGHLVSDTAIAEMAGLLTREVKQVTGATRVALLLREEKGELSEVRLSPEEPEINASLLAAAERVLGEPKAIGLPTPPVGTPQRGDGWPAPTPADSAGVPVQSNDVFIPLQTASRRLGVLYVRGRGDGRPCLPKDAQLLIALANQASAFLERMHLQAIAVSADALREADRLKSTFVSSVSHELKTPLASVAATVSNLLEQDVGWDESRVRAELEAIQEDLQRLNSSIGALLDLSRLEASAWEPCRESYELGEILGTAVSKIPQKQRGRISYDLPDGLPMIEVDFDQWARALQNLLENALSYSPDASPVRVGASHTASEVRAWVEDEGPGIPHRERELIFEKFYRGGTSGRVSSGTGLGLAVTREIVRFHGGRIWVEDVVPHGARMVISLPRGGD